MRIPRSIVPMISEHAVGKKKWKRASMHRYFALDCKTANCRTAHILICHGDWEHTVGNPAQWLQPARLVVN